MFARIRTLLTGRSAAAADGTPLAPFGELPNEPGHEGFPLWRAFAVARDDTVLVMTDQITFHDSSAYTGAQCPNCCTRMMVDPRAGAEPFCTVCDTQTNSGREGRALAYSWMIDDERTFAVDDTDQIAAYLGELRRIVAAKNALERERHDHAGEIDRLAAKLASARPADEGAWWVEIQTGRDAAQALLLCRSGGRVKQIVVQKLAYRSSAGCEVDWVTDLAVIDRMCDAAAQRSDKALWAAAEQRAVQARMEVDRADARMTAAAVNHGVAV
jgi:hypothetical protein